MQQKDEGEITVKQLITKLKGWLQYLCSKWLLIGIAAILCGVLLALYAWRSKPIYTATLSFVLSSSSQTGGLAGLASQFGLDLGGGGNDAFTGANIIDLMTSRTMVQKALLKKPDSSKELLVNILIRDEMMHAGWNKSSRTVNAYPFPDDVTKFTPVQDSIFRSIYLHVINENLTVSKPDNSKSIYKVSAVSHNEVFSLYLTKYLVAATSKFYISTKTSVAKANLDMIQNEADSLRQLLSGSISSTLRNYDQTYNLNPAYQSQRVTAQNNQLNTTAIGTAYGEVLKNLEIAKIVLLKETPLYQIIDEPQLPLVEEKKSLLISFIVGGIIGTIMISFFLITKKAFL